MDAFNEEMCRIISHFFNRLSSIGGPLELKQELSDHVKGLQHRMAEAIKFGSGDVKIGKDDMTVGFFRRVALEMLCSNSREMSFGRLFMIMSWNIMARAANTVPICFSHLEWRNDALCVYFGHMKNDRRGTRPRDPRHMYANPIMPEICPILAIGVYWVSNGFNASNARLLPGRNQSERYRKVLKRVLATPSLMTELHRIGMTSDSIGTHSTRKGAVILCSSGSTACSSAIAVHLRDEWEMGGAQDRYLRQGAAGDMLVGRTVNGLQFHEPEFAILHPLFDGGNADVERATRITFSGLPTSAKQIGEFALASLNKIPDSHPLFQSPLFRDDDR
ncbi:Hypothetical protein PHPALM_17059 [Phytophthora palmivora]|uniref:Uncharacterized protein n=1 Tax=Phytophthora palmivora TaxID=4796 RepID=A0A2P4XN97_9STRA|nr:Hypothetical protein PHPALM_17059 [Phytophthora palmivora]